MAEAHSNISTSVAGAPFQAREAAEATESRRAVQHHAIRQQVRAATDAGDTVETTDADTRVFSDTEGTGSQGRQLEEDEQDPPHERKPNPSGIIKDKDGQLHLDLHA
jgi:hypothetical protein